MLEGNLINIRVIEKEDLPVITAWSNDPEFGGEFEPLEQNSLPEIEKWYNNLGSKEKWFIIEKKDGTKIGQIMHAPAGPHYTIGYIVVPEERGKGYCTEAVKILVDYLFLSTAVIRIQAGTDPENTASQRVLEKAGFTKEGVKRKCVYARGKWHDEVLYSILREEWEKPKIITTS
ncbi:MAG: GNAT family protein [Candidatus Methanofastidiosia archaeon]|jgi:RimJ/RimL family protein N-acetyltransferase